MKNTLAFFYVLFFTALSCAQISNDSLNTKKNYDLLESEIYQPKTYFMGFHGYFLTSIEFIPLQTDLFEKLISNENIPTVELNPSYYLAWISYMRNWMYSNLSYSYTIGDKVEKDSLVSKLNQNSIALRFGYNIIKNSIVVISPYVGFRYTHFKHVTSLLKEDISLNDYTLMRDIDLRVSQFSGAIGINSTFLIEERWSVGFYASYLIDINNNPIVRTKSYALTNKIGNPINNFVIGLGFGMGVNEFYKSF